MISNPWHSRVPGLDCLLASNRLISEHPSMIDCPSSTTKTTHEPTARVSLSVLAVCSTSQLPSPPRIPVMQFLSKDTEEPEDDQQRERDSQQPENERFSHGWPLLSCLWLTTRILSMRLRAQLFQEAG
jgi:hypothetical protein